MSDSIYAPPKSNVEVEHADETAFYVVAPRKLILLMIFTLGIYLIYWFYRNWSIVKRRTGTNVWPPMRGIFYIFFTHSLFRKVDEKLKSLNKSYDWNPGYTATLVVVLSILTNVLERMASRGVGTPITDILSIALLPVLVAVMLPAQRAVNVACDDAEGASNARLTGANWAWIIIGSIIWTFAIVGTALLYLAPELLVE